MEQKNKGFTRPQGIRLSETKREDSDAVKAGVWWVLTRILIPFTFGYIYSKLQ